MWNARKAIKEHLNQSGGAIDTIKQMIKKAPYLNMDETVYLMKTRYGRVWVVVTTQAVYVWACPSRSAEVLFTHFSWLPQTTIPAVVDGYAAYPTFFRIIQRCWVHILNHAREPAVAENDPVNGIFATMYRRLQEIYWSLTGGENGEEPIPKLAPFTTLDLNRKIYEIIQVYESTNTKAGKDMATFLRNALQNMFTFLAFPGTPAHNNAAEQHIRDAVVLQRNIRHKLVNALGCAVFSILITFAQTCYKQQLSVARSTLEYILDSKWSPFDKTLEEKEMMGSLTNPDKTRFSLVDPDGNPYDDPVGRWQQQSQKNLSEIRSVTTSLATREEKKRQARKPPPAKDGNNGTSSTTRTVTIPIIPTIPIPVTA